MEFGKDYAVKGYVLRKYMRGSGKDALPYIRIEKESGLSAVELSMNCVVAAAIDGFDDLDAIAKWIDVHLSVVLTIAEVAGDEQYYNDISAAILDYAKRYDAGDDEAEDKDAETAIGEELDAEKLAEGIDKGEIPDDKLRRLADMLG